MKKGDPITVLGVDGAPHHIRYQETPEYVGVLRGIHPRNEGVAWVRGHVTVDDPLWQALLTVNALRGQVPDLEENSKRFVAGEIDQAEWSRNVDLWDEALARGDV